MTTTDEAMIEAYRVATKSPDPSTQNGAVLLLANGESVSGCNEFPDGVSDVYWNGPKDGKYARVVHAEVSALLAAARLGFSTVGSTLVCPWAACSNCAKHVAYAGVKTLVRHKFSNNGVTTGNHWYADCVLGDDIFRESGIEIIEIEPLESPVRLRRDGNLWP
jgi:deoxycytidylate deaminase